LRYRTRIWRARNDVCCNPSGLPDNSPRFHGSCTYKVTTADGHPAGEVSRLFALPLPPGAYVADVEGQQMTIELAEPTTSRSSERSELAAREIRYDHPGTISLDVSQQQSSGNRFQGKRFARNE
jgi:hypothetical protein